MKSLSLHLRLRRDQRGREHTRERYARSIEFALSQIAL